MPLSIVVEARGARAEPSRVQSLLTVERLNVEDAAINRGACYRAYCGALQNSWFMPTSLRADHHIGIGTKTDRLRMRRRVEHDLDIVEVGKREFASTFERTKTKTVEKFRRRFCA